jgi:uncharacterized membrane protein
MNPNIRLLLITIVVTAIVGGYTLTVYKSLPDQIPVHFNAAGQPDRFDSKETGAFITLWIMLGMGVMFAVLPLLSPKTKSIEDFRKTYDIIAIGTILFTAAIHVVVLNSARGNELDPTVFGILICLLFGFLGNFMGKVTPNYYVGIRTPWTLESPVVWERTHRFAAKISVGASIAGILIILTTGNAVIGILGASLALIAAVPYSYFLHRKLEHTPDSAV